MTDEAYDAQTVATSARIERLHRLRFGPQSCTWVCVDGHVNRESKSIFCAEWQLHARSRRVVSMPRPWDGLVESVEWVCVDTPGTRYAAPNEPYAHYGKSDPEELIYSRAN